MSEEAAILDDQTAVQQRQAEALEAIDEQLRIQNAALLRQTRALEKLVGVQFSGNPADAPTTTSLAGGVEDAALDLRERVDLDAVRRVADE